MSTSQDVPDEHVADGDDPFPTAVHPARELRAVVVEYDGRPDRCTVCPRAMEPDDVLTAWLTADADAFVDLEGSR